MSKGLRKKTVSPGAQGGPPSLHHEDSLRLPQNELFGNTDVIVKYVLEGHERGVNWAAFHPSSPLIVSGADDRHVKLWRMNETKAWEVDTFRGHFNNVSCVLFHPRAELLLSNSEDKTIRYHFSFSDCRVWDMGKRAGIQTFRREHDRFWILAAHPEQNLFGAGHDSGMIVFKLERERPPYSAVGTEGVYYIKDKYLRCSEFASGRDVPLLALRSRTGGSAGKVRNISFSAADQALLLTGEGEGGHYELYLLPKDKETKGEAEGKRGIGASAVFVGRKRFAVVDKGGAVVVKNLKNEETKRCLPPHPIDALFPAPAGLLLLRGEDKVTLYDVQQKKSLAELPATDVKNVYWSQGSEPSVALVSKDTTRKLEQLCVVHETIRVKSGAWEGEDVFVYSTLTHLKYCLPNGDSGIIRTLDSPLYLTAVRGGKVHCLDRESKVRVISIDPTEYRFKLALLQRNFSLVLRMVRDYNLIGQAIIAYLQRKGYPEVALHFVKDEKTKFNLALECGNLEVALECAKVLDSADSWNRLGAEALRQGNHQIVEMAYQRTKNYERLSFLYLITGNTDKLRKMLKISEMRKDPMSRFHNALYLGDVVERVRLLEEVGQLSLAYLTAATHGLEVQANELRSKVEQQGLSVPSVPKNGTLLLPPIPILRLHETNWPLLTVSKGYFDTLHPEDERPKFAAAAVEEDGEEANWGEMNLEEDEEGGEDMRESLVGEEEEGEESKWDVGLELGDELNAMDAPVKSERAFVTLPPEGRSAASEWTQSKVAGHHCAAGSFATALALLHHQVAAVNFAPLKPLALSVYRAQCLYLPTLPALPPLSVPLKDGTEPRMGMTLAGLIETRLKAGYRATTAGKFSEGLTHFVYLCHALLLLSVTSRKEAQEAQELLGVCREYVLGLRMELLRKDPSLAADAVRQTELAAYFTHCRLENLHLLLALRSAMTCAYKLKNFALAGSFARRLLALDPKEDVATQARKVVKYAEQNNQNAHELNYNERNPFVICGMSFTPIYKGSESVECPYCHTSFLPKFAGKLCPSCQISEIGKEASGWTLYNAPKERERGGRF